RCNFSKSERMVSQKRRMRPSTTARGRAQFSVEKAYTLSISMFSSAAHSTTRRNALTPALCPARRGKCRFVAQRPLPSMIIARWRSGRVVCSDAIDCDCTFPFLCDEGKRFCILANLDLQNLQFLGFSDFVHLFDETVGELL